MRYIKFLKRKVDFAFYGLIAFSCCKSLVGVKEILGGFAHINTHRILILEAECHIEYAEVFVNYLNP